MAPAIPSECTTNVGAICAFTLAGDGILRRGELGELLDARTVDVPADVVHAALAAAWRARLAPVPAELFDALLRVPVMASDRARAELARFHPGVRRFVNPHRFPVGLEKGLFDLRTRLILEARGLAESGP